MRHFLVPVALVLHVVGCTKPIQISHEGPHTLDTPLKTYALLDHPVGDVDELTEGVDDLLHTSMADRGYVLAPKTSAELFVTVKALVMDRTAAQGMGPAALTTLAPAVPTEGAGDVVKVVVVMLEEAATDRVVWVGWSSGEYPSHAVTSGTRESVAQVFARLPLARRPP